MESTQRRPGGLEKFQVTDREECGLIIENGDKMLYILKIPNRAENPHSDYAIGVEDKKKVEDVLSADERIVGFLHTHLEGHSLEPSDNDFEGAELNPEMLHLIYKPATKEIVWYGSSEVTK